VRPLPVPGLVGERHLVVCSRGSTGQEGV